MSPYAMQSQLCTTTQDQVLPNKAPDKTCEKSTLEDSESQNRLELSKTENENST